MDHSTDVLNKGIKTEANEIIVINYKEAVFLFCASEKRVRLHKNIKTGIICEKIDGNEG